MFQSQYQINTTHANLLSGLQVNYNNKSIAQSWYTPRRRKSQKKNQTRKDHQRWEKDYWGLLEVCMYVQCLKDDMSLLFWEAQPCAPDTPDLRSHCNNSLLKKTWFESWKPNRNLCLKRVAFRKINQAHHLSFQKF